MTKNNITPTYIKNHASDNWKFYYHTRTDTTSFAFTDTGMDGVHADNEKLLALITVPEGYIMSFNVDSFVDIEKDYDYLSFYDSTYPEKSKLLNSPTFMTLTDPHFSGKHTYTDASGLPLATTGRHLFVLFNSDASNPPEGKPGFEFRINVYPKGYDIKEINDGTQYNFSGTNVSDFNTLTGPWKDSSVPDINLAIDRMVSESWSFYHHDITDTTKPFIFTDSNSSTDKAGHYKINEKFAALITVPEGYKMEFEAGSFIETQENFDFVTFYDTNYPLESKKISPPDFWEMTYGASGQHIYTETSGLLPVSTTGRHLLVLFESSSNPTWSTEDRGFEFRINITPQETSAGAGGDPYIVTLDNRLYKMQNFQGYARMIQGKYENKLFTINTYTKFSTEKEADVSNKYVESYFDKINEGIDDFKTETVNYLNENEAFFDQIFIQWGNEKMLVDMNNLQVIENISSFSISGIKKNNGDTFKDLDLMDHYKELNEHSVEIKIGKLSVILSTIDNPQVKTAFRLNNGHLLKNINGAMANTLFYKDMKLKKITDTKPIERSTDRSAKKTQKEFYVNTNNEKFYKDIPVF